jgi:hypothetical protein
MTIWRRGQRLFSSPKAARGLAAAAVILLAACNFFAVQRTQQLIQETGGRGWWTSALMKFADRVNGRAGVTVASLDWGFNEQLEFLTRGPALGEPFWLLSVGLEPALPRNPRYIYLVHPPEFSLAPLGARFMAAVTASNQNAVVQPWRDDQGRVAFYSITFTAP